MKKFIIFVVLFFVLIIIALLVTVRFDFLAHHMPRSIKRVFDNRPYILTKCEHGYYTYPYKVYDGVATYYLSDGTEIGRCVSMKPGNRAECEQAKKAVGKCEKEYALVKNNSIILCDDYGRVFEGEKQAKALGLSPAEFGATAFACRIWCYILQLLPHWANRPTTISANARCRY